MVNGNESKVYPGMRIGVTPESRDSAEAGKVEEQQNARQAQIPSMDFGDVDILATKMRPAKDLLGAVPNNTLAPDPKLEPQPVTKGKQHDAPDKGGSVILPGGRLRL
jgi:hypothetical protein